MAIAQVQSLGSGVTAASGGTHTVHPTANQSAAGNMLIMVLSDQGDSVTSITDTKGNTWTVNKDFLSSGLDIAVATCIPADVAHMLTTADTVSIVCSNTGFAVLWYMNEWSGLTQTVDGTAQTGTTSTLSGLTTTNANDLVLGCFSDFHSGAVTFTPAAGWTGSSVLDVGSPGSFHLMWEYQIVSSAGAQSTSGTTISIGQIAGILIAFQGAVGGGGGGGGTVASALWPWFNSNFGTPWVKGSLPASTGRVVNVSNMSQLQTACNNALNGDVITLAAGTYSGTLDWENHSYSPSTPVTIQPANGATVTFSNHGGAGTHAIYIHNLTGVRFIGFTINGTNNCGMKIDTCNDIEINGLQVTQTGLSVEGEGILTVGQNNRIVVRNTKTYNCAEHGMYLGSFAGATTYGISGLLVLNCLSYDNYNGPATGSGGYGIQVGDSVVGGRVVSCTMDDNGGPTGSAEGANLFTQGTVTGDKPSDVAFYNCLVTNNFAGGINGSGTDQNQATNHVGYCMGSGNGGTDFTAGGTLTIDATNIHADPLYLNRAGKDFHLGASSPAIAAGDPTWMSETDFDGNARSSATASIGAYEGVLSGLPVNTVAPAVSGTATVGQILTTTNGTWTNTPTGFSYQWQRDNQGGGVYSSISSATASTYTLVDADDGCNIVCRVVATNATGSSGATSNVVGIVVEPAPTNSVAPTVSGATPAGSGLSVANGTWANMGGFQPSYTYQWTRGGVNIVGATLSSYTSQSADVGALVGCTVTAHNSGGTLAVASSNTITVTAASSGDVFDHLNPHPRLRPQ